jgi:ribosomal 50S subunit-recycling heat shock protein
MHKNVVSILQMMMVAVWQVVAVASASPLRLDAALVARGLCASRTLAKNAILAGHVSVDGSTVTKASHTIEEGTMLNVFTGTAAAYVSRAGKKLRAALDAFGIDLKDTNVLDVGASTGGFTDCALQAGASRVVAVDNGHGQLAEALRADARVVNLEASTHVASRLTSCHSRRTTASWWTFRSSLYQRFFPPSGRCSTRRGRARDCSHWSSRSSRHRRCWVTSDATP